jgi:transposase InsO family protein
MSILRKTTLCSVPGRETCGNHSSKQERDDNFKTTGTPSYGSLRTRCLS